MERVLKRVLDDKEGEMYDDVCECDKIRRSGEEMGDTQHDIARENDI